MNALGEQTVTFLRWPGDACTERFAREAGITEGDDCERVTVTLEGDLDAGIEWVLHEDGSRSLLRDLPREVQIVLQDEWDRELDEQARDADAPWW